MRTLQTVWEDLTRIPSTSAHSSECRVMADLGLIKSTPGLSIFHLRKLVFIKSISWI